LSYDEKVITLLGGLGGTTTRTQSTEVEDYQRKPIWFKNKQIL
jgi:hypothetical protein